MIWTICIGAYLAMITLWSFGIHDVGALSPILQILSFILVAAYCIAAWSIGVFMYAWYVKPIYAKQGWDEYSWGKNLITLPVWVILFALLPKGILILGWHIFS